MGNKLKDKIEIKGVVRVQLLSRDGRVVREKILSNVVLPNGAYDILYLIRGGPGSIFWNYVNIYDGDRNRVKTITGSWGNVSDGAGYKYIVLTAEDSSSDEYSFRYFGLDYTTRTVLGENRLAYDYGTTDYKTSALILRVTWEIRISYGTI